MEGEGSSVATGAAGVPGAGAAAASSSNSTRPRIEIWEPTYRMTPKEGALFQTYQVDSVIKSVMHAHLDGFAYDHDKARDVSLAISNGIKDGVKALKFQRYKVVVQTTIGEVRGQGARVASRCLWDDKTDNWASYSMKTETVWAVVTVFGLYLE
ncbi:Dynein light chain [Plasmodiophora brassicae]|uniref:Dynein light chain n=1 Tax=Plasmodiophora brassicae TaxID=37360 RepID=A0A0G4IYK2_PLABS|nr:hypothetical protein PBRA_007913 [Plasmodiophora brassicae]SPQ98986.1 unnamed protein product [Plasmodiophora brassicae]